MKINKKASQAAPSGHVFPYILLACITVFLCWLFSGRLGVFGSEIDWISQHSVIPDYFRQQFYETGELIPEFAPSLGGGQNIYNFAYYGLFSPLILPSYLLPFVKMSTYIMAVSILALTASILLFYHWLGRHDFSTEIRLGAALLFLLAGPMIFQSYRQIMFVNYMPFLILGLIGVDVFWKKHSTLLLTAGIFLVITTSFYFSICGMLVLFVYGIAGFSIKQPHKIRTFSHFLLPFFTAVFTAAILLLPTANAILVRSGSSPKKQLKNLFVPDFSLKHFTYTGYGIGLSIGILAVLVLGIFILKRREKIMAVLCLTVLTLPVFSWILNGGLYLRDKAFIPFLPLLCYLTAAFLQELQTRSIRFLHRIPRLHPKSVRPFFLLLPFLIYLTAAGFYLNKTNGENAEKTFCESIWDSSWKPEIESALNQEKGLYRMEQEGSWEEKKANLNRIWSPKQWTTTLYSSAYNQDYQTFLTDTFQTELPYSNAISHASSENPLFQKLMGVKYLVEKNPDTQEMQTHSSPYTAPVIYATDALISREDYENLPFPYNQTALMQYAVTEENPLSSSFEKGSHSSEKTSKTRKKIMDSAAPLEVSFPQSSAVHKKESEYHIQADKTCKTVLQIPASQEKRILFLQFDVKNNHKNQSMFIDVNGIRNRLSAANHVYYNNNLTFTFVTELDAGQTELPVTFSKGDYTLSAVKSYTGRESLLTDTSLYQSEFIPDHEKTKGSRISGQISTEKDGYVITSIPFDKGFEVLVDGSPAKIEKVNTAFLGFSLPKGVHRLEIIYHAPGVPLGKLLSLFGLLLWAVQGVLDFLPYGLLHEPLVHLPKRSLVH